MLLIADYLRFAVQLDQSSDVADCWLLRVHVHFINPVYALTEKIVGNLNRRVIFQVFERFVTYSGLNVLMSPRTEQRQYLIDI
jgi:hypothetical protein